MHDERQEIMKTSPRPKARPAVKSKRPMPAAPAREKRKNQMMVDMAARAGDGYAKGGMIKKKK